MNAKCSVIEDMIPLYKEGLCSEDTAEMVREHIEECADCRKLCEDISGENAEKADSPDESKVFRRVNKKMKRSRGKIILLSLLLIVILLISGYLTIGQITHKQGWMSFESAVQSVETYKIAKLIAKGDMDAYADSITYGCNLDLNMNTYQDLQNIRNANKKALNEAYDKYMKNKEVKSVRSVGFYLPGYSIGISGCNNSTIVNQAEIKYKDGTEMILLFEKSYDGHYLCMVVDNSDLEDEDIFKFGNVISYANMPECYPDGLPEVLLKKYNNGFEKEMPDHYNFLVINWFRDEYRDDINKGLLSYYKENGYTVENVISSEVHYDKENEMLYHNFFIEGKDEKGTAMMTAKIYSTPEGLIRPSQEDIKVVPNGCTEGLVEGLMHFFG